MNKRDNGRIDGGGTGTGTMRNNAEQFILPCLGQGGSGHGRGRPLQWHAARAAIPDSWARAGGAGGRRHWRWAQQSPGAAAPQVRRRPLCPANWMGLPEAEKKKDIKRVYKR